MPDWSFLALYLWLAMMMMVGLDFLCFVVIWVVNNKVNLNWFTLPKQQCIDGTSFPWCHCLILSHLAHV